MKHLLVPIDFSNDSLNALEFAIMLANQMKYDVRLIHVKRKNADYDPSFDLKDFDEVLKSGIEENFDKIINEFCIKLKGGIDYRIREGRVYKEICNQAKYADAEMIVMGTHGVSGFEEKWVGSNAFRVVSSSSCPVLTLRYNFPKRPIKKIILPIDTSNETRLKVPFLASVANIFKAEIHLVDVCNNNRIKTRKILNEYSEQVINYLKNQNIDFVRESLRGNNISESIIEYALLNDADLIGIQIEPTQKPLNIWLEAYAQQMVNHSPIPVLSLKCVQK
ncbi:MAG: universal stress protein [Salinivirgaceae bacterium]|nr:universal stress protein [Salinivirgaceae bacterium]